MEDTIARFHEFELIFSTDLRFTFWMERRKSILTILFFKSFLNPKELISSVIKIWWITNNFLQYAIFNRENEKRDLRLRA